MKAVIDNVVVDEPVMLLAKLMDWALQWIGFDDLATRNRLQDKGLSTFNDLRSMKGRDMRDLAESYGRIHKTKSSWILHIEWRKD